MATMVLARGGRCASGQRPAVIDWLLSHFDPKTLNNACSGEHHGALLTQTHRPVRRWWLELDSLA